jgi:cold shock CspA family protein
MRGGDQFIHFSGVEMFEREVPADNADLSADFAAGKEGGATASDWYFSTH